MFAHIQLPQAANDTHTNSVHEVNIPDMRLQTEKGDKKNLALFNTEFNTDKNTGKKQTKKDRTSYGVRCEARRFRMALT